MSSEIPPEKRAAALYDRLYAAFNDGLELIAIQAGYRFGWYSALAQHGPCTANQLSALTGTGPRFTKEWLRQQTAAGILDADISESEPTFRLSPEIPAALLGETGTEENTLAAMISEAFVDWMQLAQRLVEAWRHDHSGFTDADRATLASQQARFTELTAADLPGRFAAIPELADFLPRQPIRVVELGCGGGFYLDAMATAWPTAELIGYDTDPVALALAAERLCGESAGQAPAGRRPASNRRRSVRLDLDGRRVARHGRPGRCPECCAERAGDRWGNSDCRTAISFRILRSSGCG
jgi:hypothetical protein